MDGIQKNAYNSLFVDMVESDDRDFEALAALYFRQAKQWDSAQLTLDSYYYEAFGSSGTAFCGVAQIDFEELNKGFLYIPISIPPRTKSEPKITTYLRKIAKFNASRLGYPVKGYALVLEALGLDPQLDIPGLTFSESLSFSPESQVFGISLAYQYEVSPFRVAYPDKFRASASVHDLTRKAGRALGWQIKPRNAQSLTAKRIKRDLGHAIADILLGDVPTGPPGGLIDVGREYGLLFSKDEAPPARQAAGQDTHPLVGITPSAQAALPLAYEDLSTHPIDKAELPVEVEPAVEVPALTEADLIRLWDESQNKSLPGNFSAQLGVLVPDMGGPERWHKVTVAPDRKTPGLGLVFVSDFFQQHLANIDFQKLSGFEASLRVINDPNRVPVPGTLFTARAQKERDIVRRFLSRKPEESQEEIDLATQAHFLAQNLAAALGGKVVIYPKGHPSLKERAPTSYRPDGLEVQSSSWLK